jgi:hypothetical protein
MTLIFSLFPIQTLLYEDDHLPVHQHGHMVRGVTMNLVDAGDSFCDLEAFDRRNELFRTVIQKVGGFSSMKHSTLRAFIGRISVSSFSFFLKEYAYVDRTGRTGANCGQMKKCHDMKALQRSESENQGCRVRCFETQHF